MPQGIEIQVSVPGWSEVVTALGSISAAEQGVAHATHATVPANKAAAEASEELGLRSRSLLNELRSISPEMGIAVESAFTLATRTTMLGMAMGLIGPAIMGTMLAFQGWNKAQKEADELAAKVNESLQKQNELILKQAEAVEKLNLARDRQKGLAMQAPEALVSAAAQAAAGGVVGAEGVQQVAEMEAAGGAFASDAERRAAAQWIGMGKGAGVTDPRARRAMFAAEYGGGRGAASLAAETQARMLRDSSQTLQRRGEIAGLAAGVNEPELILGEVGQQEAAAGRPGGAGGVRAYLEKLAEEMAFAGRNESRPGWAGVAGAARGRIESTLQAYPELGRVPLKGGQTIIQVMGNFSQGGTQINQSGRESPAGVPRDESVRR